MPNVHRIVGKLKVKRFVRFYLLPHEIDALLSEGKDSLRVIIQQVGLSIIIKIARTVSVWTVGYVVSGFRWLDALVVPFAKVSGDVVCVGFFQSLWNRNLAKVLFLRFNRRKDSVTQPTRGHAVKEAVAGRSAQSRR